MWGRRFENTDDIDADNAPQYGADRQIVAASG
jgi:hypothetical protein